MRNNTADKPSATLQLVRIKALISAINAVDDALDEVAEELRDFHGDDESLPEAKQLPHLEAIDLQRAMDDTARGVRAMRRILAHHRTTLTASTHPAEDCSKRAHLSPVRDNA